MNKTIFAWIASAAAAAAIAYPALAQTLPDGAGKDTVQTTCSGCHDISFITDSVGFSKSDWELVIKSMIDMGAAIKPEQATVIVDYLAQNFPPKK